MKPTKLFLALAVAVLLGATAVVEETSSFAATATTGHCYT